MEASITLKFKGKLEKEEKKKYFDTETHFIVGEDNITELFDSLSGRDVELKVIYKAEKSDFVEDE